jgi:hypothetical protein
VFAHHLQPRAAISGTRNQVAFFTQSPAKQVQHAPFIFNDQEFHGTGLSVFIGS